VWQTSLSNPYFIYVENMRRLKLGNAWSRFFFLPVIWVMKSRRMRRVGHTAHMGCRRGEKGFLAEKPGGQRPFGRPRSIWQDNFKMDLQAHTDHSHDSRTTKWKKLSTVEPNGL
jgi:hypothetical protein